MHRYHFKYDKLANGHVAPWGDDDGDKVAGLLPCRLRGFPPLSRTTGKPSEIQQIQTKELSFKMFSLFELMAVTLSPPLARLV